MSYLYIHIGNVKEKTKTAIGLALRAHIAKKRMFIGRVTRPMKPHELSK